jgi:benzoyl-CoA reductase subunit D
VKRFLTICPLRPRGRGRRRNRPKSKTEVKVRTHEDSIHAGAIGAALWGAFRHEKLAETADLKLAC